jgi:hypothetical protein
MKNKIFKLKLLVLLTIVLGACTNLDEEFYGRLSPDNYYNTPEEALSSVVGVYEKFSSFANIGDVFRPEEFGTDEFFVPGRTSGGWFSQDNIDIMRHQTAANNGTILRAWNYVFPMIGTSNAVIESLESSPSAENFKGLIAETKAMRAYGYFYAMDLWGNIPIFTDARVDPNNLPATNSRSEVFEFVVTELKAAAENLPSVNDVDRAAYYPRLTKEAVYSALAMVYLNAEVYSGTAHWADVIDMCDKVINSNAFELEPSVGDVFLSTNENNHEVILAFSMDPTKNAGNNQFILYTNPALDKLKYNLPFSPAGGYSTDTIALNRYEDIDERRGLIDHGPQYYLDGVTPLADADGNQLILVPLTSITAAEDNEGFKVTKYSPIGAKWSGYNADNDLVLMRYADILLMKAEALFRTDKASEALPLVNQVRTRSDATPFTDLSLKKIENERAREFIWEGYRRRDMIRFGSYFNTTWSFKETITPEWRGIYPIPAIQLSSNPNLDQNPNY